MASVLSDALEWRCVGPFRGGRVVAVAGDPSDPGMLTAGVHPKVVSERLGHSNISVTMDTYSHVLPGLQEAAAQTVDEQLGQR